MIGYLIATITWLAVGYIFCKMILAVAPGGSQNNKPRDFADWVLCAALVILWPIFLMFFVYQRMFRRGSN